jgi:hypothetical protein
MTLLRWGDLDDEPGLFSWELTGTPRLSTIPGEYKREFFEKAANTHERA